MSDTFSQLSDAENNGLGALGVTADVSITKLIERAQDTLVVATTIIGRPHCELYAFWIDFSNLPKVLEGVDRVVAIDDTRSVWAGTTPDGIPVEWVTARSYDRTDKMIAWTSDRADLVGSGRIEFHRITERSTKVVLTALHERSVNPMDKFLASLQQCGPAHQTCRDLYRLRRLMEARNTESQTIIVAQPYKRRYLKVSDSSPWYDRLTAHLGNRVLQVRT